MVPYARVFAAKAEVCSVDHFLTGMNGLKRLLIRLLVWISKLVSGKCSFGSGITAEGA